MLSILIPVYNYDVRGLVLDLFDQINLIKKPIEIILLDDGSDAQWQYQYDELETIDFLKISRLSKNQGRVNARNQLAALAAYPYLLFIDCDAKVISEKYISNYLDNICQADVLSGGHVYQDRAPEVQFKLHWEYGRKVEARLADQRNIHPYQSFSTFNFCISKEIFQQYFSNVDVKGYGHEDTFMGYLLHMNDVTLKHITNPLLHAGLKEVEKFLSDTDSALRNAVRLSEIYADIDIKVVKYASAVESAGFVKIVNGILNLWSTQIESNLRSRNPKLSYLKLYKLKTVLTLKSKN